MLGVCEMSWWFAFSKMGREEKSRYLCGAKISKQMPFDLGRDLPEASNEG